jgi:hypothetical protein
MANHLIIGLGGTGGRIIRAFRKIVYRDGNTLEPEGVNLQYLYIDSSTEMMAANDHSWKILDQSVQLNANDQIHLDGGDLKSRLDNLASYPQLRPWIGDRAHWNDILNLGAGESKVLGGQKRILGRFLFACKIDEFVKRLSAKMGVLRQSHQSSATTVHIFAGLAGGTGSGCLIDVIAQVRSRYPSTDCKIHVYTLLPERYPKSGWKKANYHANGYAALTELNALSVGTYRPYDLGGHGSRLTNLAGPFQACYVITNENDNGMQFDVEAEMPESVAMFLYQKIVAGADGKWPDLQRIEEWENQALEAEDGKRSRLFLSFGLKQITYPEDEIKDYLSYSLSQQVCAQMLYNNWAHSYIEEPVSFNSEAYVRQPKILENWCLTRRHLFLETAFTQDELEIAEQNAWRPFADIWSAFVGQIYEDVKGTDDRNAVALMRKRCRDYFETGFSGGNGVKGFYAQRISRLHEYSKSIVGRIEGGLLRDVFEGRQSLSAVEGILNALRRQASQMVSELESELEKTTHDAARAKTKLDKNVEEFESLGTVGKMFGLKNRILEVARDNARDYFTHASALEGGNFAQEFLRHIEAGLRNSSDALAKFVRVIREASVYCKEKCTQLKPKDVEGSPQDFQKKLKGVWIRLFDSKEIETYLNALVGDQGFQSLQAKRGRDAIKTDLLVDRLELAKCGGMSRDGLLDCLTKIMVDGLREANLNMEVDGSGVSGRLKRLLSVSVVDKLNDRYHGEADIRRTEIETIVRSARDFVQFNSGECSRSGMGTIRDGREESFAIAIPDASQNEELKTVFQQCSQHMINWVDTKGRRRHEITLLKFTQLFPLRFLTAVEFLREEYSKLLKSSSNPDRAVLELHTDRELALFPPLFVPDPGKTLLPRILIGTAVGAVVAEQSDNGHLYLLYDKTDGASAVQVPARYSLGIDHGEAVARLNVETISFGSDGTGNRKAAWEVLDHEVEQKLKHYQHEDERRQLKEKIVSQIDLVAKAGRDSRQDLEDAAASALKILETRWKAV